MPLKTPVPDDFFSTPPLSPDKIQELRAIGYKAQRDLIEYTKLTGGPIEWTLRTNDDKVQVYTAREGNLPLFLGTTEVESSLDEVRAIFTAPTTADVRRVDAAYFPDVLDEVRLYTLSKPTEDRPHHLSSVSWTLLRSPLQGLIVRYRDFCCIEHLQDVEIGGKKAWIRACKSIVIPACPDLEKSYGIIRAEFIHSGFIYMETDKPGILRVTELEHFSPNGRVTGDVIGAMLMASFAESQYNSMNSMQANVYAHRLCQVSYLPLAACVNKHSRTKCAVCLKKFGTFARKSNCRRCGEVVCSKVCSAKYKVMMANLLVELRVCSRCIPGPGNAKQQTPMSTLRNEFEQDDMSAYSEPSYSVFSKALKRRESTSSATTNLISSSSYSGHDMFALSTMDHSMAFVNFNGYDDRAQHDPRGKQTVNYFESPRGATPRRRGDMLLLN
ncbi:unnamed protein product [Aphanomyces euteiches]|uniref:FYVE-type domain-containing protein n=1 Tax=Aphanomyces euteiches TaxID=100861 RepID=A0A6G0XTL8_9STRA|nr:hypothetical protein Ae201684_001531 [Aphanomyces euteiches]KAH9075400.1 hypothetical protein Ae201684P_004080 [Aphanomyces euteiches]